jgi:hypothetical protein
MNFSSAKIAEEHVLIDYKGVLSYDVISQLINRLKDEMNKLGEKLATYKRILIIMVEVLENASRYIDAHPEVKFDTQFLPFFTLAKKDFTYFIFSGNLVKMEDQETLRKKIDELNGLTQDELKQLYRKIISNGKFTNEGGAGLGFIEIAKTSNNKIQYSFDKVNELYAFYAINLELTN